MADNTILSRLDGLKLKYEETGQKLTDPEVIADVKQFVQLNKEYKELEPIIETSERYRTALANLAEAKDILANDKDEEMREMARGEITELEPAIEQMEEQIKLLLIPKDPQDSKNAIMEIRGGTGGDEAAIFAGDLLRMYTKYIESKGWRYEMTSFSDGAAGGYKEVVLKVTGQNVYGTLKYESGVHRVQRVPQTETQGRVHTSAASVAVLPVLPPPSRGVAAPASPNTSPYIRFTAASAPDLPKAASLADAINPGAANPVRANIAAFNPFDSANICTARFVCE